MIRIITKIPRSVTLAFSGGVDSVAAAHFLSRNHDLTLLFVDHRTEDSKRARKFVQQFSAKHSLPLKCYTISKDKPKNESKEEFWRNERYKIFHAQEQSVITCHHLDDCVETWVWSSLHGCGKLIPRSNRNVIRPFLTTRKSDFSAWAMRNKLAWCEDDSNFDTRYTRNYIRHKMMADVLHVNPGIHKTIRKKLINNACFN
jgi:tRNA(Ile)-lysidine synthase